MLRANEESRPQLHPKSNGRKQAGSQEEPNRTAVPVPQREKAEVVASRDGLWFWSAAYLIAWTG